jgi:hypothetical protein
MLHRSFARPTLRCTWGVVRFERETQLPLIDQARKPLFLHRPGKPHGRKIRAMQFGTLHSGVRLPAPPNCIIAKPWGNATAPSALWVSAVFSYGAC